MPTDERKKWTADGLKRKIGGLTRDIGKAVANQDDVTANTMRDRRASLIRRLAARFDVWTLINVEGKTEFVDKPEWEQRMIAWGRRQGLVRRPRVNLDAVNPPRPTGTDAATPPPAPPTRPAADETGQGADPNDQNPD